MNELSARRLAGLDLVRSAAILFVVIAHYWPLYKRFPGLEWMLVFGVVGVELFFVLSGFLIGGILFRQNAELTAKGARFTFRNVRAFWTRRWFRTLPNYFLFFVFYLWVDKPWGDGQWGVWALNALFLQNLFVDYSNGTYGVAWSLCVEEWLYLLLPLVLLGFSKWVCDPGRGALVATATLIIVPTLLRCFTTERPWDIGVRHIVIYRLDAIAYGVLLAYVARYRRRLFLSLASCRCACIGGAVLLGLMIQFCLIGGVKFDAGLTDSRASWFFMHVVFFSMMSMAIVPLIAWASEIETLPRSARALVHRTSLYSYSIYLAHGLLFYWCSPWIYSSVTRIIGEFPGLTFIRTVLDLAILFGISALVYHLWEAPMTRLRERFSVSSSSETQPAGA